MPRYTVVVDETRTVECLYLVEAATPEEALVRAAAGETVLETSSPVRREVVDRAVRPASLKWAGAYPAEDAALAELSALGQEMEKEMGQ